MSEVKINTISKCRACGSKILLEVLSLGNLYVSNFMNKQSNELAIQVPLEMVLCQSKDGDCGLIQLRHTVSNEAMYENYWYRSGINKTMTDELNSIAAKAAAIRNVKAHDYVIDIGANDGTLLRGYKIPGLNAIGFEPAKNLELFGKQGTTKIIVDFFSYITWELAVGKKQAKIITAIGMFYDLDDPNAFISDIVKCLDDDGLLVIQMMYLPFLLERNAFDGICHEHLGYYSLFSLESLLDRQSLEVCDVEMREQVNEGSVRFFIKKVGKGSSLKLEDGAQDRVAALRAKEVSLRLDEKQTYDAFAKRIFEAREQVVSLIKQEVSRGKKVHGYAASTKGNTTLQFYGLTRNLVEVVADRNPFKWGKFLAGTLIPVVSEEESRARKPDYYFVLAWHFLPEFMIREAEYLKNGGKLIVPMPEFRVIGT